MNTNRCSRQSAISLVGAIIVGGCLVVAGAVVCGCIVKLAKKIPPTGGEGGNTNTVQSVSYVDTVRNPSTGQMVPISSLNLATNASVRIMVQRWFQDGRPEQFLYITDADVFHEFGIIDESPDPIAGFYHIYLIVPQ